MFCIIYKTKKNVSAFEDNFSTLERAQIRMKYFFKNKNLNYIFVLKSNKDTNKINLLKVDEHIENLDLSNIIFWWKNENYNLNIDFEKIKLNYFDFNQ